MCIDRKYLRFDVRWSWCASFLLGGYTLIHQSTETTAVSLTATLAYLALYPEEQEKAYNEIISIIFDRDPVSFETLE